MMAFRYEDVNPTLIENTSMQKIFINDVHKQYSITPNEGYVLHDNAYDVWYDIEGNELTEPIKGYRRTTATCGANYDFVANPREFYAVPENEVPADQIFGGSGNNEPEIM